MSGDIGTAAVLVVIGAALLAVAFGIADGGDDGGSDRTLSMAWDDYRENWNAREATGAVEISMVGGTRYVHAKELGTGEVVTVKGERIAVTVEPAEVEVVMVMGQSNMAYYKPVNRDLVAEVPAIGTAYYFGSPTIVPNEVVFDPETYNGIYDMIDSSGKLKFGDKGPTFCSLVTKATGHKVLWLSLGVPGKAISEWDVGGRLWTHDTAMMEAAISALEAFGDRFEVVETYALWGQGGHDWLYSTGYDHYIEHFTDLYSRIMAGDLGMTPSDIYMMPTAYDNGGWVLEAQAELVGELPRLHDATGSVVDTFSIYNGLMWTQDRIHFTQIGDNMIANVFAHYILESRGVQTAPRVYLVQHVEDCGIGEAAAMPSTATAYLTDGTTRSVSVSWQQEADTSAYGTKVVRGSADIPDMVPSAPDPLLIVRVGYLGELDGIEYMQTGEGECGVYWRSADLTDATVPSEAFGLTVTSVLDWGLYRGPWASATIPDTVTSLGAHAFGTCPLVRSLSMSESLDSVQETAIEWLMNVGSTRLTESDWTADPSILGGDWTGTQDMRLRKVGT